MLLVVALAAASSVTAAQPLVPEDLYLLEGPQSVTVGPDGEWGAFIRRWIDPATKLERFSLWRVSGDVDHIDPLETSEAERAGGGDSSARQVAGHPLDAGPAAGWEECATGAARIGRGHRHLACFAQRPGGDSAGRAGQALWPRVQRRVLWPRRLLARRQAAGVHRRRRRRSAHAGRDRGRRAVVRPDQGEGYTGYTAAQLWVADLHEQLSPLPVRSIRRLTNDDVWYGDPQWTPDGRTIICHANKSSDVESVRFSINKNYDLWAIDVESGTQRRLTFGPGPEVSPRIAPTAGRWCASVRRAKGRTPTCSICSSFRWLAS